MTERAWDRDRVGAADAVMVEGSGGTHWSGTLHRPAACSLALEGSHRLDRINPSVATYPCPPSPHAPSSRSPHW